VPGGTVNRIHLENASGLFAMLAANSGLCNSLHVGISGLAFVFGVHALTDIVLEKGLWHKRI
jgi:hypothetical protein